MKSNSIKATRGRPKTLNREHILDVAIQAYWEEGVDTVSLNELCKKAKVSKPGLYREFGNEDGLRKAALLAYEEKILAPLLQMLTVNAPFRETLDNLVTLTTTDSVEWPYPKGCLFVNMRESHTRMGEATREQIDHTLERVLTLFEHWVERSREKGEFSAEMSSKFAATYIYSQISYAQSQMARGEEQNRVREILTTALSMLR